MRKFIGKGICFLGILVILLTGMDILSARNVVWNDYFAAMTSSSDMDSDGTEEMIAYVELVRQPSDATKLILGDSVCHQIYGRLQEANADYCIAGSNRAITMTGQYLLLQEFLNTHEKVTDVYVIVALDTLGSYFDALWGYPYAVLPFVETDTFQNLNPEIQEMAAYAYGKVFLRKEVAELISHSKVNRKLYFNLVAEHSPAGALGQDAVSRQNLIAMQDMLQLCEERGVTLHILPGPMIDQENRHQQAESQKAIFQQAGLYDCMETYYGALTFYPEELFIDGTHIYEREDAEEVFADIITDLQSKTGELTDLDLTWSKDKE